MLHKFNAAEFNAGSGRGGGGCTGLTPLSGLRVSGSEGNPGGDPVLWLLCAVSQPLCAAALQELQTLCCDVMMGRGQRNRGGT